MSEARKKSDWLVVASLVLAVALVPLALYVAGYFALSSRTDIPAAAPRARRIVLRSFSGEWQAKIYRPAAKMEGFVVGKEVIVAWASVE